MTVTGISANRLELLQIADAVAREKSIEREVVINRAVVDTGAGIELRQVGSAHVARLQGAQAEAVNRRIPGRKIGRAHV